jgi:NitT/TauT family transport system ATP-binding protein
VVVTDLRKSYELRGGAIETIRSASFEVKRGGFVSILGPSGCGKSTLLMILAGIIPPSSGNIAIDSAPVIGPRRETSLVFQIPALFPWRSVLSNVLFPIEIFKADLKHHQGEAIKLLEMTGLIEFKDRLPEQLSGGMAQRVSLCRALITNPELLLMDEPFSALDALTRDEMCLELQHIWEKFRKTVVFVTHSIREAVFLSDRVIVLSHRPAVIISDICIELPRPRTLEIQESAEFNQYCAQIRANIGVRGD